jgi:archaellum component FlaC
MKSLFSWFNRLASLVMATVLVFTLSVNRAEAKAVSLEAALTEANQDYLASVMEGYTKSSQATYGGALKQAQKLVNGLADDLEKAADPDIKVSDRTKILQDVNTAKATLADLATTFQGLATDTDTFDQTLQASVEDLLARVKGDVRDQLSQNKTSLAQIGSAIADLSDSAAQVSEANLISDLESFGRNINALNAALAAGGQSIKATTTFFKD